MTSVTAPKPDIRPDSSMGFEDRIGRCEEKASQQLGVITSSQCAELGVSSQSIARLVRRGRWSRPLPGVFMPRPVPDSWWTRAKAATLWGGSGSVLCGRAAARARGLEWFADAPVEIAVPDHRRTSLLRVRHYKVLPLEPTELVRTVPLISAEAMSFELCRSSSYRVSRRSIGRLVRDGRMTDRSLFQFLNLVGGKGVEGTRWVRAILEERGEIERIAETDAEVEFARLAASWGLDPIPQYRLRSGRRVVRRFDFALPELRIGIEVDGDIHADIGVALEDADKDREASKAGWIVLRFTNDDLYRRPWTVRAELFAAIEARQDPHPVGLPM